MARKSRTLVLASFPMPFSGETALHEIGLRRLPGLVKTVWHPLWVQLAAGSCEADARAVAEMAPAAVLLHIHRSQVADALAFANALGRLRPGLPLILCGWAAHPPYVEAVAAATGGLASSSLALLCGEVEAVMPRALARMEGGGGMAALAGVAGIVVWDPRRRAWQGSRRFVAVEDLSALPAVPQDRGGGAAGWVEVSRGCRYRCAFCFMCCYGRPRMRRSAPERVRADIRAAAAAGVRELGLYTTSVSLDIELFAAAAGVLRELRRSGVRATAALGPIGRRFLDRRRLELLAQVRWGTMTVGLQTITPRAQRLSRRPDDPETFARTMEFISGFTTPEVETILGLPGDSPEGFRRTIEFALKLPVNVAVMTFRLDPWSSFLAQRGRLKLKADFSDGGRVYESASFPAGAIAQCRDWLRALGRAPWTHRARALSLDGVQLNDSRPGRAGRAV